MKRLPSLFACAAAAAALSLPCVADTEVEPGASLSPLALDAAFGKSGELSSAVAKRTRIDRFTAVALDSQGRIVVAGERDVRGRWRRVVGSIPLVARFRPDGRLDRSFGGDGVTQLPLRGSPAGVVLDSRDRPVVVGDFTGRGDKPFGAFRLTARGALDRSYSKDGLVAKEPSGSTQWRFPAIDPEDDGLVLAMTGDFGSQAVVRIDEFGTPGWSFADVGETDTSFIRDLAVGASGRILLATDRRVIRLRASGLPDFQFGDNSVLLHADGTRAVAGFGGLAFDAEGRIALHEEFELSERHRIFRFLADGTPDTGFSGDGRAVPHSAAPSDTARRGIHFEVGGNRWVSVSTLQHYTPVAGAAGSGVLVQAFDADAPGAVASIALRDLLVRGAGVTSEVRAVAVAPDGSAAFVAGFTKLERDHKNTTWVPRLLRVDLTPGAPVALPDLVPTWETDPVLQLTPEGDFEAEIVGTLRVTNAGGTAVARVDVNMYLSDDDAIDTQADQGFLSAVVGPLEPGGSATVDIRSTVIFPASSYPGRRLLAAVNLFSTRLDADTTNDLAVAPPFE